MFFHNFKYGLITLLKDKMLVFWTLAFPLLLGTFFNMAFSDIENSEKANIIPIAVVEKTENDSLIKAIQTMSEEGSELQLFRCEFTDEAKAQALLAEDDIVGYLRIDETPKVIVKKSGISETILQYVTDQMLQTNHMVQEVVDLKTADAVASSGGNPINQEALMQQIYGEVQEMLNTDEQWLADVSNEHMSYTMIEYYSLIAMACMYGGILGMAAVNRILANMSNNGKRIAVSPCSRSKLVISSACAAYLIQLVGCVLLFLYTIYALHVDYGVHFLQVALLTLVGCLAGLSLGIVCATVVKKDENTKTGILVALIMLGSFLSGMMGITMKYVIDKNIPLSNQLNPVNMITDALYSLYYYGTFDRYYRNLISLGLFALLMLGISVYQLRRQKYDRL